MDPYRPRIARRRIAKLPFGIGMAVAVVLVAMGLPAVDSASAWAAGGSTSAAPAPVSNAFALGGGVGGSINQRTGAFQASIPLLNVAGRAGVGLSLALSYDQSLAAQGAQGDRFGFGAGWSLGVPWVDTAGGVRVYPASGGSYLYDTGSPSGLRQYPLRDLSFAKASGVTPARLGLPKAQSYAYTLATLDGTVDRFDASGNLVEEVDRFGNRIDLTWRQSGPDWQPTSVVDNYGQVTSFDYTTAGQVKVDSPTNAEGITATATLRIYQGHLVSLTDPLNQSTMFGYSSVPGLPAQLLSSVVSPTGAHTTVTYTPLAYEAGVVVVNEVTVTDAAGNQVVARRHFNVDPPGNLDRHNFTGYPNHVKSGTDGLFDSGDLGYRYSTELSDGTSTVEATYNSLHLMVAQKLIVAVPGEGAVVNQLQTYTYPTVTSVAKLPPNYAQPTSVKVVYGDSAYGATRTEVTASTFNNYGQVVSATDAAGTTTATTYDEAHYGLPIAQTVSGEGAASITTNTLTATGTSIEVATTATGTRATTATARTTATYAYDSDGQLSGETLAWAPGAAPKGPASGPDKLADTQTLSVDTATHTETDVVTTAAGTPQAASTVTVSDLVTGEVLSQTDPDKLVTTYRYDALGRIVATTKPGGQTTTTSYPGPLVTDTTQPNGLITQTTTDVVGRTVEVTNNVSDQKLVGDPAATTLETDHYSVDGSSLTTTTPAGTTTTTFDALGRPVRVLNPDKVTQTTSYNDVANAQTTEVLAAGASPADPTSTTTSGFDALNQPSSSTTVYPDGTAQTPTSQAYDGLGRVTSFSADGLTATPDYSGTGGLQTGTSLTPDDPTTFPGPAVTTGTDNTMNGSLTTKTLTQASSSAQAGGSASGATYTYDAAGRVARVTDQDGKVTAYTYTAAGQVATVTDPSGTVTTYTYSPDTGRLQQSDVRGAGGQTERTAYTYYPATGLVKSVYDPDHPTSAVSYDYDPNGHVVATHYPDGTTTAATYADNGQLATTTDVTGAVTTYTYNHRGDCGNNPGDLCTATQTRDGALLATVSYTYDDLDRVQNITRGNGVRTALTYNDANQVHTETTSGPGGTILRADAYAYDAHGNVAAHTVTVAGSKAVASVSTTAYAYDAYNRLVRSATYPGATATGTPTTTTHYDLNVAGDVTGQTTTTGKTTTIIVNTIDPGDRLTTRTVDGVATEQDYDTDGNVTRDLAGDTYTYNLTDQPTSVTTPAGVTTTYTYWPDRTRRSAATNIGGVAHITTYHYSTTGQLVNDSYTETAARGAAITDDPSVTASYLMDVNREARTLTGARSYPAATGPLRPAAQTSGTGYYLTDAHGSVDALVDDQGQVTASYAYADYGQPVGPDPAIAPSLHADADADAAVNPFTYDGAYTNPTTGTQYLPARTYDPDQGRFLSLDSAYLLNRYQAFDTNPISYTDPTGQLAVPQWLVDGFAAALFIVFGAISAGTAAPVFAAVIAGEEAVSAITAAVVLNTLSAVANLGAGTTSLTLTANDVGNFLTESQKDNLNTANFALGAIAGITSAGAAFAEAPAAAADLADAGEQVVRDPADFNPTSESESGVEPTSPLFSSSFEESSEEDLAGTGQQGEQVLPGASQQSTSLVAPDVLNPDQPQVAQVQQVGDQNANLAPVQQPAVMLRDTQPNANVEAAALTPGNDPNAQPPDTQGPNYPSLVASLSLTADHALDQIENTNTPGFVDVPTSPLVEQDVQPPASGLDGDGLFGRPLSL